VGVPQGRKAGSGYLATQETGDGPRTPPFRGESGRCPVIMNSEFDLTNERIGRLNAAGVLSLRDQKKVLDSLDLSCRIVLKDFDLRAAKEVPDADA
jgi:hypothetical protein